MKYSKAVKMLEVCLGYSEEECVAIMIVIEDCIGMKPPPTGKKVTDYFDMSLKDEHEWEPEDSE